MARDTLRKTTDVTLSVHDQMRSGTVTGTSAKGYGEHSCDGSSYDKYGNRVDFSLLAASTFK